jgi:hypothetical protein
MNIDKRMILLLAVTTSAAVAAFATRTRRQIVHAAGEEQHKTNLHAWENEGGNLAPIPASALQPVVQPAV